MTDAPSAADRRIRSQQEFNRVIMVVLAVGLGALAILGAAVVWLGGQTAAYNRWVEHTYQAQQAIITFRAEVERMETSRRGYLLAPTDAQLRRYREGRARVANALLAVSRITADNAAQQANIAKLRPLLAWKVHNNDDSVELARHGRVGEAQGAFSEEQTLQPLIGIRLIADDMTVEEQRLLTVRTGGERHSVQVLQTVALLTAVLLGVLSVAAILAMRRFAGDLTAAQDELRALNEALEQRVRDRTADLTRANEEIQRFAYIVSHDLRSPLVNIMGFTAELEEGVKPLRALVRWIEERDVEGRLPDTVKAAVDTEIPEAINFIRTSTRKMDRLIAAILKLSREGRRTLNPERLDLEALVRGMFTTVHHQLAEAGADAEIEGALPDIVSDRLAVEQVVGNLVDNAIKYRSPARPLRLRVRGRREGDRVVIEVEDNGRGVAPKDHERIFELFRRSGAQNQPGEGIGLAHVRALVHRLGGVITVSSALDQGAVFRLSLPSVLSSEGPAA